MMQGLNEKYYDESTSVYGTLRSMEIGDVVIFPLERFRSVRSMCSMIGLETTKHFCTKSDRKERMLKVKRTY